MKALYLDGATVMSREERAEYFGWRVENANAFGGVSSKIESAVVIGDYPNIVEALESAGVDVEVRGVDQKLEKAEVKAEPEVETPADDAEPSENVLKMVEYFKQTEATSKPKVKETESAVGIDTNGDELDVAWKAYKAG